MITRLMDMFWEPRYPAGYVGRHRARGLLLRQRAPIRPERAAA